MNLEYGKICSKMQKTRKRGFSMMIRKAERRDREEYIRMAHEFYHSPAVLTSLYRMHILNVLLMSI